MVLGLEVVDKDKTSFWDAFKRRIEELREAPPSFQAALDRELQLQREKEWEVVQGCSSKCPTCSQSSTFTDCPLLWTGRFQMRSRGAAREYHIIPAFTGYRHKSDQTPILIICRSAEAFEYSWKPGASNRC